jgi:succinyl-diaminopimelate desuccinylase
MIAGSVSRQSGKLAELAGSMEAYRNAMLDALFEICRIPSCKAAATANAPYGEQTVRALETFLALGRSLGFSSVNLDNRAGYLEWGASGPITAILGHLDVVPAGSGWSTDPFSPLVAADRVVGRGTMDDKGPVIAALYGMKALADSGFRPNGRIRLIVGLDEENGSSCMAHYVRVAELPAAGFTPDAYFPVVYAEKGIVWLRLDFDLPGCVAGQTLPGDDSLRLAKVNGGDRPNMVPAECRVILARGPVSEELVFSGRSAHASTPWEGQNAISAALLAVRERLAAAGCRHPFLEFYAEAIGDHWNGEGFGVDCRDESGPLTLNAGLLSLDGQHASLTLDIRCPVTRPLAWLVGQIQAKTEAAGARLSVIEQQQPLYAAQDSPLVAKLLAVYRECTGLQASPMAIGGGTYARTMPNIVAFGPLFPGDEEVAHKAGESIGIQSLLAMSALYREALRSLAG